MIAVTDWVRAVPDAIARFVPQPYVVLGTDGYGISDIRARRRHFEVDAAHVVGRRARRAGADRRREGRNGRGSDRAVRDRGRCARPAADLRHHAGVLGGRRLIGVGVTLLVLKRGRVQFERRLPHAGGRTPTVDDEHVGCRFRSDGPHARRRRRGEDPRRRSQRRDRPGHRVLSARLADEVAEL